MLQRQAPHVAGSAFLLLAFWLAMTGSFDCQRLLVGAAVVTLVLVINRELLFRGSEARALGLAKLPRLILYFCLLLIDVIKAKPARGLRGPQPPAARRTLPGDPVHPA